MTKPTTRMCLFVFISAAACGPPGPGDGTDDSPALIETQCTAFCERAIACESEEYSQLWAFTTRSECVDACLAWTHEVVDALMSPGCEVILGDKWECAGMIEECDVWRSYEDVAFGMPGLAGNPCRDELTESTNECNP